MTQGCPFLLHQLLLYQHKLTCHPEHPFVQHLLVHNTVLYFVGMGVVKSQIQTQNLVCFIYSKSTVVVIPLPSSIGWVHLMTLECKQTTDHTLHACLVVSQRLHKPITTLTQTGSIGRLSSRIYAEYSQAKLLQHQWVGLNHACMSISHSSTFV